jgi:hypothetical protein
MLPEKAFQPRNGRQGMTLEGGGGGGGPQTNTTYTSNIPEWLRPQTEALLGAATQEYFNVDPSGQIRSIKPYRAFSEDKESYFAPFNRQQQNIFGEVGGMTTSPLYGSGAALAGQAGVSALGYGQQAAGMGGMYERMATSPSSMEAYMSPYMQQVVERQKLAAIEDAQRANLGQNLAAARQGTYGGARQALAQSQREAALEKQLGDIQAGGLQSAFEKAQQAQQFGVQTGLQGLGVGLQGVGTAGQMGSQLADIAGARQAADVQRIGLQSEIGAQQQAREQAIIDQRIQDYALAEQYPYQQLSAYSGLLRGYSTPTTSVSQYKAAQSPITQLAGTGIQLGGAAQALGIGGGKRAGGQIKSYAEGGIASVDALEGTAEKLSIPQLQQSMRNDTLPEYIGMPILENKVNNAERMQMAQGIAPDMGQQVPIADKVMQRANALQGINSVQTAAGGGMVAFNNGGVARFQNRGVVQYDPTTPFNRMFPDPRRRVPMTEEELAEARRLKQLGLFDAVGELTSPLTSRVKNYFSNLSGDLEAGFSGRDLAPPAMNPAVVDEYPGIDFTDADIAKALGKTPQVPGQGGITDVANQANEAGPARQGGPGAPGGLGETPAQKELSRAELFAQREKEQKEFLGEDPRIEAMKKALEKQGEEGFLDRAMRGLQYVVAGEKIKQEGDTSQLEKITQSEMARRKAMADREMKRAELEGAEYQRKADIYKEVAGEERKRAETKEERAFQEKLLNRKLEVEEKLAKMRPASATAELVRLGRSKDPIDQQIYKDLTSSKSGAMTRQDAAKLALQANPGLGFPGKEEELEAMIARIMGSVGGGFTPTAQQQSILDKYKD